MDEITNQQVQDVLSDPWEQNLFEQATYSSPVDLLFRRLATERIRADTAETQLRELRAENDAIKGAVIQAIAALVRLSPPDALPAKWGELVDRRCVVAQAIAIKKQVDRLSAQPDRDALRAELARVRRACAEMVRQLRDRFYSEEDHAGPDCGSAPAGSIMRRERCGWPEEECICRPAATLTRERPHAGAGEALTESERADGVTLPGVYGVVEYGIRCLPTCSGECRCGAMRAMRALRTIAEDAAVTALRGERPGREGKNHG